MLVRVVGVCVWRAIEGTQLVYVCCAHSRVYDITLGGGRDVEE